jgi:hypothetical protein
VSDYRQQVADAVAATTVHSSGAYSWYGRRLPRARAGSLGADAARAYDVAVLEQVLYESFYCRGVPMPSVASEATAAARADSRLVAALSSANAGRGCWESGWRVAEVGVAEHIVTKAGLRLNVNGDQVLETDPRVGAEVSVRFPKELPFASPGFYTALSDLDMSGASGQPMVRVYLHVTPQGAAPLMNVVTSTLNAGGVMFRVKIADSPGRYERCDTAVLYARAADFDALRPTLREVRRTIALRPLTPAFTKALAAGIGLGEHPTSGESFGADRCRLLAAAIVAAGRRRRSDRIAAVEAHFAAHGIDLDAPYLVYSRLDRYAL